MTVRDTLDYIQAKFREELGTAEKRKKVSGRTEIPARMLKALQSDGVGTVDLFFFVYAADYCFGSIAAVLPPPEGQLSLLETRLGDQRKFFREISKQEFDRLAKAGARP